MRIAEVAPILLPVPPEGRGGIELVVSNLTEELVKRGHQVTLFASGDSTTSAKLVASEKCALTLLPEFKVFPRGELTRRLHRHLTVVFDRAAEFDIIHGHFNTIFPEYANTVNTSVVTTYHMPVNAQLHEKYLADTRCNFISLTRAQQAGLPGFIGIAPNGIKTENIPFQLDKKNGPLIFVGRIATKKGPHHAINVAKKTGLPLNIIGKTYPQIKEYWDYYQEKIKPAIDGKQIQHIEELSNQEVLQAMSKARALLMPIEWEEPFGLVMIEAMATGTPVIAFNRGSVPEVVVDGKTGFICDTIEEMEAAVGKLDQIKSEDCRKHIVDNFTIEKMTDAYESIYQNILLAASHEK